jgi:hypothetical protein
MVAAINNGGGFYRPEIYSRSQNEWRNDHNPCINKSVYQTTRGWNGCVFGFYALKNLKREYIFNIVAEREKMVHSKSIENFITRVPSGLESIQTLIYLLEPLGVLAKQNSINYRGARMLLIHHKGILLCLLKNLLSTNFQL